MAQSTPFEEWIFKHFLGEDPQTPHIQGAQMSFGAIYVRGPPFDAPIPPTFDLLDIQFYVLLEATENL